MVIVAAYVFAFLACVVVCFQICLAVGAPWGHLAMGGRWPGKFPPLLRVLAVVQMGVILGMAWVMLVRAGILHPDWFEFSKNAIWAVVGVCSLSALGNVATPSKWERILWGPVAVLMLVCSAVVALG